MRAWLDCSSGISGDKFLAALIDAGWSLDALRRTLSALEAPDLVVTIEEVTRRGVSALQVHVSADGPQPKRTWREIRALLERAPLDAKVRDGAIRAFALLAQAEGRVHGSSPDDVHFHEVGAWDSIADIVGVSAGLAALGIDDLLVSPVAIGSGVVDTEHGTLPVPAPATALLLQGVPTDGIDLPGEVTTPTGAALVRAFASGFGSMPAMTVATVGHGAGSRELPIANVARLVLGELDEKGAGVERAGTGASGAVGAGAVADAPAAASIPVPAVVPAAADEPSPARSPAPDPPFTHIEGLTTESIAVLESNLDHLSPEHLAFAAEQLLQAGALDVWQTPIVMKKGRSAVTLSVMTAPDDAVRFAALVIELTGALGVRRTLTVRDVAPRRVETVKTSLGAVRVKVALIAGRTRVSPEHDDIAAIAARERLPYDDVVRIVTTDAEEILAW